VRPDILPSSARPDGTNLDPRVRPNAADVSAYEGLIRVMGLGRGIDPDDCGKAAMKACNDAVDAYFASHERTVRGLGARSELPPKMPLL
jgi:hypothetical protein